VSITGGNPGNNPGPDNYGFSGEGSAFNGNQGNGGDQHWIGRDIYDYNGRSPGEQGQWQNRGPMQLESQLPNGQEVVYNIQNAYFNLGRAFGGGQNGGGYDQFANPRFEGGPQMDQQVQALAARELQNYFLQQQEAQMMNSERWAQNNPAQNYYSPGYNMGGIPPYYGRHHRGQEYAMANSGQFYSGFNPGYPQTPGFSVNIGGGRHGGGLRFFI
jgi:hypothetical protein